MSGGWQTIESDAGVFTHLIEKLGVRGVQFEELVTLELEELLSFSPVYGVIFLFKIPNTPTSISQDAPSPPEGEYTPDAPLFFASQTIQNACGTQAALSILLNHTDTLRLGSTLTDFHAFTASFPAQLRGEALSNSPPIREAHNACARASPFISDPSASNPHAGLDPDADPNVYHFVAYTPVHGTLWELDGLQPAPISHGECTDPAQFPARVLPLLQRRIARHAAGEDGGEIRFNLLALVADPRERARQIGDVETLRREAAKRADWRVENALRAWNFMGFTDKVLRSVIGGVLKGNIPVAKDGEEKVTGDQAFEAWIDEAKVRREKRLRALGRI